MKLKTGIKSAIIGGLLTLCLALPVHAENKFQKVYNWIKDNPNIKEFITQDYGYYQEIAKQISKEEDISKFDYKWRWDIHNLFIFGIKQGDKKEFYPHLFSQLRQYKEHSSPNSRQYILYKFADQNADGKLEKVSRDFQISQSDGDDFYYFISPEYPEGFINKDWYIPSNEEAHNIYNKEIDYWLNQIK